MLIATIIAGATLYLQYISNKEKIVDTNNSIKSTIYKKKEGNVTQIIETNNRSTETNITHMGKGDVTSIIK